MPNIFGILNNNDIVPSLLQGLQCLQLEEGNYELINIATLKHGRIQQQKIVEKVPIEKIPNLATLPQQLPISGNLGIICTRPGNDASKHQAELCVSEHFAFAYCGFIKNLGNLRAELQGLGYELDNATEGEVILRLIHRYLEVGISPTEASVILMSRLEGYLAILALFTEQQDMLIAARRGYPLAIGVDDNKLYVGSDTKAMSVLCQQIIQISEGSPVILHSFKPKPAFINNSQNYYPCYPPFF